MLDKRVYEDEYLYAKKASLSMNTISENIFSQPDEEGNRFMLFDDIVDHRVYGLDTIHQDAFIVSNN